MTEPPFTALQSLKETSAIAQSFLDDIDPDIWDEINAGDNSPYGRLGEVEVNYVAQIIGDDASDAEFDAAMAILNS